MERKVKGENATQRANEIPTFLRGCNAKRSALRCARGMHSHDPLLAPAALHGWFVAATLLNSSRSDAVRDDYVD